MVYNQSASVIHQIAVPTTAPAMAREVKAPVNVGALPVLSADTVVGGFRSRDLAVDAPVIVHDGSGSIG